MASGIKNPLQLKILKIDFFNVGISATNALMDYNGHKLHNKMIMLFQSKEDFVRKKIISAHF